MLSSGIQYPKFLQSQLCLKPIRPLGQTTILRNSRINMLEKHLRWTKHLKLLFELIKVNFYICLKLFELILTFGYQSLPCYNFWPVSVSSLVFSDFGLWSCLSAPLFLANSISVAFFFFFGPFIFPSTCSFSPSFYEVEIQK